MEREAALTQAKPKARARTITGQKRCNCACISAGAQGHRESDPERLSDEEGEQVDHVYDLTAAVGHALIGFKHDLGSDSQEERPFQALQHI